MTEESVCKRCGKPLLKMDLTLCYSCSKEFAQWMFKHYGYSLPAQNVLKIWLKEVKGNE